MNHYDLNGLIIILEQGLNTPPIRKKAKIKIIQKDKTITIEAKIKNDIGSDDICRPSVSLSLLETKTTDNTDY